MRRIIYFGSIPKYEPEVIRFLNAISVPNDSTIYFPSTAYQITGSAIWEALNTATESIKTAIGLTLKADNLSTKFKYIYPRIGGTSTAHRYNLVTGTADGTYNGGFTHDATGSVTNPMNDQQLSAKFLELVVPVLGDRRAQSLLAKSLDMTSVNSAAEILQLGAR